MKKLLWSCVAVCAMALTFGGVAGADPIYLYVDAAPNVYGSADYPAWLAAAYAAAANGTFVNMANGINPANVGTTDFEIQDEVVYSFGDLGNRLTFIYWIPDETVANLGNNDLFQINLTNVWDGDVDDFYLSYYGQSWLEPTKWENYTNAAGQSGVIGTAGMAWWGAYGVNTQAALDADIASWIQATESWIFTARLNGTDYSLTANRDGQPVPEPATMTLLGIGLAGMAAAQWRRTKS
ncbi:MAG: PEP-CTERM sorting domain-containing protein [Candidatus Hydrogenedentes bacterium]|nr:PEP-CTERM sorting domain-containing protein [Candidatus Hydrogenedentota bacterium]